MSRRGGRLFSQGNVIAFGLGAVFGLVVMPRMVSALESIMPGAGASTTTAGLGWRKRRWQGGGGGALPYGGGVQFMPGAPPSAMVSGEAGAYDASPDDDLVVD